LTGELLVLISVSARGIGLGSPGLDQSCTMHDPSRRSGRVGSETLQEHTGHIGPRSRRRGQEVRWRGGRRQCSENVGVQPTIILDIELISSFVVFTFYA